MQRSMIIPVLSFFLTACGASSPKQPDTAITIQKVEFSGLTEKAKAYYADAIRPLYEKQLLRTGFNGAILFAKNGEIVFEDYRGDINFKTKEPITPTTPFHLASISKTFTAMTILRLMEQGRIDLEDPVYKYLTGFPYTTITVKNLLSHRSGLPKYDHFMSGTRAIVTRKKNRRGKWIKRTTYITDPIAVTGLSTNADVLKYLNQIQPPLESQPNRRYHYCNTNYALLALIIEKITGQTYPQYLKDSVFTPLGMQHSYVFSVKDTANYIPSYNYNKSPFKLEKLDCVYGDKNVYSTVRDLLIWDRALYQGSFIKPETFALSIEPLSNETRGIRNYGLGWHLVVDPPNPTIVYHNGWWHGNNTVFRRLIADTATIIVLGNRFNRNIWSAGKMSSVFTGRVDTTGIEE
ncbi:MAG: beta-lactamase family protein [Chitinophagaceae bacterium]|nr:beta-lactamase family protein [Chitinophagaceae bacterium]